MNAYMPAVIRTLILCTQISVPWSLPFLMSVSVWVNLFGITHFCYMLLLMCIHGPRLLFWGYCFENHWTRTFQNMPSVIGINIIIACKIVNILKWFWWKWGFRFIECEEYLDLPRLSTDNRHSGKRAVRKFKLKIINTTHYKGIHIFLYIQFIRLGNTKSSHVNMERKLWRKHLYGYYYVALLFLNIEERTLLILTKWTVKQK